jgi:Rad3-related DNA helicase
MQRMEPTMTKQKKTIAKTTHAGTKVRKQLASAEGESVLAFFTAIAALRDVHDHAHAASPPRE